MGKEILYREGVAIKFDLDDPVIRRRVTQKMSFVADGVVRIRQTTRIALRCSAPVPT